MRTFAGLTAYLEVMVELSLYSQLASEIDNRSEASVSEPETVLTKTLETTDEGFRGLPSIGTTLGIALA